MLENNEVIAGLMKVDKKKRVNPIKKIFKAGIIRTRLLNGNPIRRTWKNEKFGENYRNTCASTREALDSRNGPSSTPNNSFRCLTSGFRVFLSRSASRPNPLLSLTAH